MSKPFFANFTLSEGAELFLNPAWGKDRRLLRQGLIDVLKSETWGDFVTKDELAAATDLTQVPRFSLICVSISHTEGLGGFAICRSPIGFDLEREVRTTEKIVSRVSTSADLTEAPSPGHLWAAKEASFKALQAFHQPQTISEISIGNWRPEKSFSRFDLRETKSFGASHGHGIVDLQNGFFAALCFIR